MCTPPLSLCVCACMQVSCTLAACPISTCFHISLLCHTTISLATSLFNICVYATLTHTPYMVYYHACTHITSTCMWQIVPYGISAYLRVWPLMVPSDLLLPADPYTGTSSTFTVPAPLTPGYLQHTHTHLK